MKKWINAIVQWCYKFCQRTWIIVLVMCMVGCSADTNNQDTVIIEGCEYLENSGTGMNNYNLTHKGNCKNHTADTVYIPVPSESHSQIK